MNTRTQVNTRNIRIGEWLVPYDDAERNITLERTIADVLNATPGDDGTCMNSRCIKRHRQENIFPHPVYIVSTIKTRVYIVDQLDSWGDPAHAIRYELSKRDARLIAEHDSSAAGEPGELVLRVPSAPKGTDKNGGNRDTRKVSGKRYAGKRPVPVKPNGATARFKVAVGAGLTGDGS